MKKLIIMAAILVAGVAANAASFKWTAGSMYAADGTTKWAGAVSIFVEGVSTALDTQTAVAGNVANKTFEWAGAETGTYYDFYVTFTDGDNTYKSGTVNVMAQATSTAPVNFGSLATSTKDSSNWSGAAVPEPTSGLLMLLGLAGLALKRKRA